MLYVVHPKLTHCCMSIISQKKTHKKLEEEKIKNNKMA